MTTSPVSQTAGAADPAVSPDPPITRGHAHYALAVLTVTYVFNFIDRQLLAILVEPIKAEFGVSDTQMGLLYGFAFALFYATLAIPVAALADRGVRRNILATAAGLWSLMTVLCGLAGTFWQLLVVRIGVAVGEAGGVPPSQSLVADYYPPEQRARAMAIFSSATFIGTFLALAGGAYLAQTFGWRTAFVVVGAPGLVLAVLIRFTLREPPRGAWDATDTPSDPSRATIRRVFKQVVTVRPLLLTILGCSTAAMAGYGISYWTPAFLMRVHGSSLMEAGALIGIVGTSAGLIGSLFGGWLCDRLSRKDQKWLLAVPAVSLLVSLPMMALFFLWPATANFEVAGFRIPVAVGFYCVAGLLGSWWAAPTYVAVQALVAPRQRTVICAVLLLAMNLIGFGLGPLAIGVLSDSLQDRYGAGSIRIALLLAMITYPIALVCYWSASRTFSAMRYELRQDSGDDNHGRP